MADINQDKEEILMRMELELSRIEQQKKEIEYRIFSLGKEQERAKNSLADVIKAIEAKKNEIESFRNPNKQT